MSDVAREARIAALRGKAVCFLKTLASKPNQEVRSYAYVEMTDLLADFAEAELSASRQREEAQAKELLFFRDTDRYMEWCDVRVLERAEAAEAQVEALTKERDMHESLAVQHARKQGSADGFQLGFHAALTCVQGGKSIAELQETVPVDSLSAQVAALHEALRTLPRYVVVSDTPSYYETPEGSWLKVEDVAALLAHPEGTPTK